MYISIPIILVFFFVFFLDDDSQIMALDILMTLVLGAFCLAGMVLIGLALSGNF